MRERFHIDTAAGCDGTFNCGHLGLPFACSLGFPQLNLPVVPVRKKNFFFVLVIEKLLTKIQFPIQAASR